MRKNIGIIFAFMSANFKSFAAYRGPVILYFFTSLFHIGAAMLVWLSAGNQSFPNYTKPELIGYYIVLLFMNWWLNWSLFTIVSNDIKDGTILKDMIRPYSYVVATFGNAAGFKLASTFLFLLGTIVVYLLFVGFGADVQIPFAGLVVVPALIFSIVFAILLNFIFRFVLALTGFWLTDVRFADATYYTIFPFLAGDIIPTHFLPTQVQAINNFLPFRYQLGFPIEILLGKVSLIEAWTGIGVGAVWLLLFYFLYRWMWHNGTKAYQSFGQ